MAAVTPAPDERFWAGKRVLLTGHTGFKGSWLSLWLVQLGTKVSGYALPPPTIPSLFEAAKLSDEVESTTGDVRDYEGVLACVRNVRPDVVIHMAAQALVRHSYDDPVDTFSTNVMGAVHMLEAARHTDSVRVILNVTSDKCYENRSLARGYRETDPMGGSDPYSASKGCAELVASAYRQSFLSNDTSARVVSVRAGNVIGGGDWARDRLIPDCIRSFMNAAPVVLRNPEAIRPWQHVLEPLSGYLMAAKAAWAGANIPPAFNFGPLETDALPVVSVVERIAQLWGKGASYEVRRDPSRKEAPVLMLDAALARMRLGWCSRLSLDAALAATVNWYRSWTDGRAARDLCLEDIRNYECLGLTESLEECGPPHATESTGG